MSGDYLYNSVTLLLHCDGTNGATTFTDNSPLVKTMTANGNAQISTAQSVFGGASALFDGTGDWVSTPAFSGVDFGAGDFTIEGRVRFSNAASALEVMMGNHSSAITNASATFYVGRSAAGKLIALGLSGATEAGRCDSTTTIAANTWYAFAYVRSGSNFYLFINSTLEATATSSATLNTSVDTFSIGRPGAGNNFYMTGYVDEVRITKGFARHAATYTLDIEAFPDVVLTASAAGSVTLPMLTMAAYTGGALSASLPMPVLAFYAGATFDSALPMIALTASSGAGLVETLPMLALLAAGHDATGENAADLTLPALTVQGYCGANAALTLPSLTQSATGTSTGWGRGDATLPALALAAAGTVSAMGDAHITLPMFTCVAYGGAVLSVTLGAPTLEGRGITGGVGSAAVTLPMFEITASATEQNHGGASLVIPALRMVADGKAWLTLPSLRLTAIGTATVTASYEAYAVNLNHKGFKDPVDEVTRYTNFPFTQILRYRSSYYGVAADGLYLLEGTTDHADPAPTEIMWAWKTSITDFSSDQKKTLASAYFGGRMPALATITTYLGETGEQVYDYRSRQEPNAQNYRQVFGKGAKARYWAVGVEGEGELALDTVRYDTAELSRRI